MVHGRPPGQPGNPGGPLFWDVGTPFAYQYLANTNKLKQIIKNSPGASSAQITSLESLPARQISSFTCIM